MTESVRCPACRGSKKVPKLGGIIGECNTCKGKGTILAVDKPVKVEAVTIEDVISKDLINAVADSVDDKFVVEVLKPAIKVDGKKAVFKRKASAK